MGHFQEVLEWTSGWLDALQSGEEPIWSAATERLSEIWSLGLSVLQGDSDQASNIGKMAFVNNYRHLDLLIYNPTAKDWSGGMIFCPTVDGGNSYDYLEKLEIALKGILTEPAPNPDPPPLLMNE